MSIPHILVLDNSPRSLGTSWFGKWFRQLGCRVSAYDFWRNPRPVSLDKFDALVIGGSPASATEDIPLVKQELEIIEQADDRRMPVLGVCFGAQLLARAYYGKKAVRRGSQPEFGWHCVHQTPNIDPLFKDIPSQFTSFQFHLEEVVPQPDMQILACSPAVWVQAFRVGQKPVWGTQFHLEVTPRAGLDLLRKTESVYQPHGFDYETMAAQAQPSGATPQLFVNLLKTIRES